MSIHYTCISCMYRVYFLFKLTLIWYNVLNWGVALRALQNTHNSDYQQCCQEGSICWKICCAQYHVQRVMLSDVCCVTWSASRMCGHHWQIHNINMSYVNRCTPFNILQSAFVMPPPPPMRGGGVLWYLGFGIWGGKIIWDLGKIFGIWDLRLMNFNIWSEIHILFIYKTLDIGWQ